MVVHRRVARVPLACGLSRLNLVSIVIACMIVSPSPSSWSFRGALALGSDDNVMMGSDDVRLARFVQGLAADRLASDAAAVVGGDKYVARMLPVLTRNGVRLVMRAFLMPFRIAVEKSCGPSDPASSSPHNTSKYRHICNTDPNLWEKDWCSAEPSRHVGHDWCTKFAAEWAIPYIIERSPWAATDDNPRVDAMVMQTDGLCHGPYKVCKALANHANQNHAAQSACRVCAISKHLAVVKDCVLNI
jgi:hypothetical protein